MKTEYGRGRKDVIDEMINYCLNKITAIHKHEPSARAEVNERRKGVIKGCMEVIRRLNIKLDKMEGK